MSIWLIAFYCFVALCVAFFWFMLRLSHPRFRNDIGDPTTETGYEEDPVGRPYKDADDPINDSADDPHVISEPGSTNSVI